MFTLTLLVITSSSWAHSNGQIGKSKTGCTGAGCHGANATATTTVTWEPTTVLVGPNTLLPLGLTVASSDASKVEGGLNVSASGGTLSAGTNTKVSGGEITHPSPQIFSSGAVTFNLNWKAPAVDGTYTLFAAGNAVNGNGFSSGDAWNLSSDLVIEVDSACTDADLDGMDVCNGDCDDSNAAVFAGAVEVCDGLDNDCNLDVDDVLVPPSWYPDLDHDGYGTGTPVVQCDAPPDSALLDGDCDDSNANVSPGAQEVCDPADIDEDCDLVAEELGALGQSSWWVDGDTDGYGTGNAVIACDAPAGYVAQSGDCDDGNSVFNPGAAETDCADPNDYNCDGSTGFADADGDSWAACAECNDGDATAFPGATEVCDGDDENCDGTIDEPTASDAQTFYVDADRDGHGIPGSTAVGCTAPDGYAATDDDCDDAIASVYPGATEIWYDNIDQNCDGNDNDQDLDGVGAPKDCADLDPMVYPGATDVPCDDIDLDCNAAPDDSASPACAPPTTTTTDTGTPPVTDTGTPPVPPDEVSGCGCAAPTGGEGASGWLLLAVTAARAARSRRARG